MKPFKVGERVQRVRIHPASDWFMRGERYAEVLMAPKNDHGQLYRLRGERSGRVFWLHERNILPEELE